MVNEDKLNSFIRGELKENSEDEILKLDRPMCRDCKIRCDFKNKLLDRDENATCLIPMRRKQSLNDGSKINLLDEEVIKAGTVELLDFLLEVVRDEKDFGKGHKLLETMLKLKQSYWPATVVQKNMNMNLFDDSLKKWLEAREMWKKQEEERKNNLSIELNERGLSMDEFKELNENDNEV